MHGLPHLEAVRSSITTLYRRLSADTVRGFGTSVLPGDVAFADDDDLYLGVQRVARVLVRHLRLPDARMVVAFRDMRHAGSVELGAGPEYFVEVNSRFKEHRRDIGAVLAHEVMHVYLHRLGLWAAGRRENEILTDTAAAYLGSGWLELDAFREDALSSQKLGWLTPEEFGYVLAKRALLFGEDPSVWFTSPQAYRAYVAGAAEARRDALRPPLAAAGRAERWRYARDRRRAGGGTGALPGPPEAGYVFEAGVPSRVTFPCPVCRQRLRVPAEGRRVRARCGLCGTVLECDA